MIGASIIERLSQKYPNSIFIKLQNVKKLDTETNLIMNKIGSVIKSSNIKPILLLQISGNDFFPAIPLPGHAHFKYTPDFLPNIIQKYLDFAKKIYATYGLKIILLAPFPRLTVPICNCNQSISYQDSVQTTHLIETIVEEQLQSYSTEVKNHLYVLKSNIYLRQALSNKEFFYKLLQENMINKTSKIEKLAKRDSYIKILYESTFLGPDQTHLTCLGEKILVDAIRGILARLRIPVSAPDIDRG